MKRQLLAFIVPTGIGASIGGFAGDAGLWARKFARHADLIVNPNVVNAACFSAITSNMFYCEGWALTQFFKKNLYFKPSINNKIGIIFDKAIPQQLLNIHINTMNAVKTVYGTNIMGYEITEKNCGVEFFETKNKISSGSLNNPKTLLQAGEKLVKQGAEALAVVTLFKDSDDVNYVNATGIDVIGGIEAVISHYLSKELHIPTAHSPAFGDYEISTNIVNPKVSAEYITPTFLPCILLGLQNAPLFDFTPKSQNSFSVSELNALIMPYNSLGSSIVFDAVKQNIKIYAVKENFTVLNVDKNQLNIDNNVIDVENYQKCLELILQEK